MGLRIAHVVNLGVAGLLVGNEFATWAVVHRAVEALAVPEQVTVEQALTRRYLRIMPVLMTGTVASSVVVTVMLPAGDAAAFRLTLAATGCFSLMLAVTLAGNMPLNAATLRTGPDVDPSDWRQIRGRWNSLHSIRVLLDVTGFLLLILALVERT